MDPRHRTEDDGGEITPRDGNKGNASLRGRASIWNKCANPKRRGVPQARPGIAKSHARMDMRAEKKQPVAAQSMRSIWRERKANRTALLAPHSRAIGTQSTVQAYGSALCIAVLPPARFTTPIQTSITSRTSGSSGVCGKCITRKIPMPTGTVKWFNSQKGYGFIQPDEGGSDVFVHISAVERAGMSNLDEGQKINYEVVADQRTGKSSADNLSAA